MAVARQTFKNSLSLRDSRGFVSVFRWWQTVDTGSGADATDYNAVWTAVIAAVQGLTNCATISTGGSFDFVPGNPAVWGGTGQFSSVVDKALMSFMDSAGHVHRYHIPAPLAGIFRSDLTTVINDGTNALVAAFVSAMKTASGTAYVSSRNTSGTADSPGAALVSFIGGHRLTGKEPKRFNSFIKSAALIQGEGL